MADTNDDVIVFDVGRQSGLLEFLREQEIDRIRSIYLSHADQDHIGALVGILASKEVSIEKVLLNADASKNTKVWDDLAWQLDCAHQSNGLRVEVGLVAGCGETIGDVEIEVLGPSQYLATKGVGGVDREGNRITSNSMSAVIRVSVSGQGVALLPGDIDQIGLDELLRHGANLHAEIVVYPHHGGRPGSASVEGFAKSLLNASAPKTIVFSIGRGRYGTPRQETTEAIGNNLPDARIVCTQLSKNCATARPRQPMSHLSNMFALGRSQQACCGGTIVVPLDSAHDLVPDEHNHKEFIRLHVQHPLCDPQ